MVKQRVRRSRWSIIRWLTPRAPKGKRHMASSLTHFAASVLSSIKLHNRICIDNRKREHASVCALHTPRLIIMCDFLLCYDHKLQPTQRNIQTRVQLDVSVGHRSVYQSPESSFLSSPLSFLSAFASDHLTHVEDVVTWCVARATAAELTLE
jgi:hypothetical protein